MVSIHGPLGYGPSTLPLRHSAIGAHVALKLRHLFTPFEKVDKTYIYIYIYNTIFFCFPRLQSDIVHQSVYELVHSEDREELQRQLMWNSFLPAESAGLALHEALQPQHQHLLERSFTVRFRCLLDNTSGFLVSVFIICMFI